MTPNVLVSVSLRSQMIPIEKAEKTKKRRIKQAYGVQIITRQAARFQYMLVAISSFINDLRIKFYLLIPNVANNKTGMRR